MKSLLLLILIGGGAFWAWRHDWPSKPLRAGGARLEHRLDRDLSHAGVTDADIAVQVHRERSRWGVIRWVETDREIAVDTLPRADSIGDALMRTADDEGFSSEKDHIRGAVLVDITHFGFRFERVVLFPRAPAAVPVRRLLKR